MSLADLFLLSFFINFPKHKDINTITNAMKNPIELINVAKHVSLFKPLQLAAVLGVIFLSVKIYKLISGNGYKEASEYGAHGTARFSNHSEIFNDINFVKNTFNKSAKENLKNTPGLILGLIKNKPLILPEKTKIPNRNVFIVGSPGSGKTQSYILPNIIFERNRSMVISDPKGEIFEAKAKVKQQQGYEVRLINFKEMLISDRYNPIDYITKEIEAEQVANTIVINSMQGQKPDFWTKAEIALLKTLLLYVKYETPTDANLANVKRILTTHGSTPLRMDQFFSHLDPDHPAFSAYQIVRMASDKVRDSIFVSLAITLSKFDAKDVRRFTETSDFLLDDIGRKKMIVYIILPVADSTWEPLTANFFTQMFQRLYDVADKNFNRLPVQVNLLLDEFPNLGKIPGYEEILATCRSYGISSSTIVQSMGQLIDKYNKEKAEAIFNNCSLRYMLGVGDKLTAEYFSDLIGKTTIQTQSSSISKNSKGGSDSKSNQYTDRNLRTIDELTRMPRDEAILLVSGGYPIQVKKAYQHILFKGILHDDNKMSRFDYFNLTKEVPTIQANKINLAKEHKYVEKVIEKGQDIALEQPNKSIEETSNINSNLKNQNKEVTPDVIREILHSETFDEVKNMDNIKELVTVSIKETDSLIQSFDNKLLSLEEKECVIQQHEQQEEGFIIPLELDEDELILNMIPEEELLSSSLQAEFKKELSHHKDELEHLEKKEEKIPFTLDL
ncbi:type IV secretory system conjugative DNA transfer family protein [Neobacillus pocheonensis]|uniref:Type IV secretory system conjugative DNA transfer family protein n=1 Tax=Neobacillus pocheonensis TaxID=363869 RepID=A0ABT0WCX4_9BACI|nr:type IV secretory system conjugative DNA transfer family protein [Neobacillus pocheonensis]